MINRLAVILIGQYRTFAVTHKYLFEFFKDRANQVDYYFITWPTSGGHNTRYYEETVDIAAEDITKFFTEKNLVDFRIVDDIPKKHTFYRMAYLSHIGARVKADYENKNHFLYDQVVETRPDIYLKRSNDLGWQICDPLTYGGHQIETFNGHLFMDDCYIRSDSKTHNIISDRITQFNTNEMYAPRLAFANRYKYDHHSRFADWLVYNNIQCIGSKDYASIHVVRNPKLIDVNLDSLSANELNGLSYDYIETRPRPRFLSVYRNIEPREFTATHNIFVEAHASSLLDSLRYAALLVDKIRYFQKEKYDWIRYIQNNNDNPDKFFKRLDYARTDTVYFSSDSLIDCNFYCHPDLFSLIGNVYKLREKYRERTDELQLQDFFTICNIRAEKI